MNLQRQKLGEGTYVIFSLLLQRRHSVAPTGPEVQRPVQGFITSAPYSASRLWHGSERMSRPTQLPTSLAGGSDARSSPSQRYGIRSAEEGSCLKPHLLEQLLHLASNVLLDRCSNTPDEPQTGQVLKATSRWRVFTICSSARSIFCASTNPSPLNFCSNARRFLPKSASR